MTWQHNDAIIDDEAVKSDDVACENTNLGSRTFSERSLWCENLKIRRTHRRFEKWMAVVSREGMDGWESAAWKDWHPWAGREA